MLFVRIQSTELFGFVFTWIRKNANTVVEIFTTYCSECNIEGYFTVLFTSVHALSGSNSILPKSQCRTPCKTQTEKDKWTDAMNRSWCILALKCAILWQYFNDLPDNRLTKFRAFIS